MTRRVPAIFWPAIATVIAVALVASGIFGHSRGFAGMSLGVAGSAFNLWALWAVISLSSKMGDTNFAVRRGTLVIVLAFLVKLPVFIALGMVANRIGGAASSCFLLGIGLVYLALVGWALAQR